MVALTSALDQAVASIEAQLRRGEVAPAPCAGAVLVAIAKPTGRNRWQSSAAWAASETDAGLLSATLMRQGCSVATVIRSTHAPIG